jgi:hypothetical protein
MGKAFRRRSVVADKVAQPQPHKKGHQRSVECIRTFMAVLRMLKYGTTIIEISRNLHMGRRQVHRWLNVVDEVFGIERIPGGRPIANWMYRINRDKIKERF